MKKRLKSALNKYIIIMFILIVLAEILLRLDNKLLNVCGMVCLPLIIVVGIIMIIKDNKED